MPTAVVTGANSGIGLAFAKLLLQEGYKVYALDRNYGEGLNGLSSTAGGIPVAVDVTQPESIQRFRDERLGAGEGVDLLLNVAGIASPTSQDSLSSTTLSILSSTFAVNTFGPLLLTQALLPNILLAASSKNAPPKIGIVSSRVGSIADNSSGGHYAYRASKAAVNSIGKSLAVDLREKGVVVLLLHPGIVRTGLLQGEETVLPETVEPEEAAGKLWRNVVREKGLAETGTFWHREGFELPW